MAELRVKFSCKDFDSYSSFLKRLVKNGTYYVLKNDCILCAKDKKFIGRHTIQDPLYNFYGNSQDCFVENGIYVLEDINKLIETLEDINENKSELRKNIQLYRNQKEFGFVFNESYYVPLGQLFMGELDGNLRQIDANLSWFNSIIRPVENISSYDWTEIDSEGLIKIRDGALAEVTKTIDGRKVTTRIAKSLFVMAGVSRYGTPIAQSAQYTFLPSKENNIVLFEINAKYKCGQSTKIILNCIHEYLVLIYD